MLDNKIEYVYIEMVLKQNDKYEVIPGLLQGIKEKEGSTFVLLHGKKDITNIINLKFYNIMTIEVLREKQKDMIYFKINLDDQKIALITINKVFNELIQNNYFDDKDIDLINITKYTNVPEDYYDGTIIKPKTTSIIQTKPIHSGVGDFANTRTNTTAFSANKTEELEPSFFNRTKTKKPSKSCLLLIQEKIDQINIGKFDCKLPEILDKPVERAGQEEPNMYEETNYCWMR